MLGDPVGTGVAVNFMELDRYAPDEFLAVKITADGQKVVMNDKDPAKLAQRLRVQGINAVITTSGQGFEDFVF